jgi:hypothetical protein
MKKLYIIFLLLTVIVFSYSAKAQLVYKDVAQIFFNNCTSCHHTGGGAPMPLMNFSQTSSFASSILYHVQDGHMPPWSPDTTYSRFMDERTITQAEKNDILSWVNSGALAGDTTLAPAAPIYTSQYKLLGTPTITLQMPTFASNAGSTDSYVCFSIPTGLSEDRILRAYEIIPGNPEIVHHVIVNVDTTGTIADDLSGQCFNVPGEIGIGGYAPGASPIIFPGEFPLKAGIRIPGGSNIVLQLHYPPNTLGMIDSTKIRMYFYPLNETGIRPVYNSAPLQNWSLYIPANTVSTFTDVYPNSGSIPAPISMFATFPHSHKVCTSIVNYAYSGTDTIPLVRINEWDFMWQGYYTYPKLMKIPAGYKLFSKHVYDNTVNNPNNPHNPPSLVTAGTGTTDEMLFDAYLWLEYQTGDELIDVEELLSNDPLLNPLSVNEIASARGINAFIYPNPATDKLSIYLSKKSEYKVRILNITGQSILNSETFADNTAMDVSSIPAGLYIVEVIDSKTNDRITKKIVITD